jgi:hypothetical protein
VEKPAPTMTLALLMADIKPGAARIDARPNIFSQPGRGGGVLMRFGMAVEKKAKEMKTFCRIILTK